VDRGARGSRAPFDRSDKRPERPDPNPTRTRCISRARLEKARRRDASSRPACSGVIPPAHDGDVGRPAPPHRHLRRRHSLPVAAIRAMTSRSRRTASASMNACDPIQPAAACGALTAMRPPDCRRAPCGRHRRGGFAGGDLIGPRAGRSDRAGAARGGQPAWRPDPGRQPDLSRRHDADRGQAALKRGVRPRSAPRARRRRWQRSSAAIPAHSRVGRQGSSSAQRRALCATGCSGPSPGGVHPRAVGGGDGGGGRNALHAKDQDCKIAHAIGAFRVRSVSRDAPEWAGRTAQAGAPQRRIAAPPRNRDDPCARAAERTQGPHACPTAPRGRYGCPPPRRWRRGPL
jgi:hypothetical protein